MSAAEQFVHCLDGIARAPPRPVAVGSRFQIGLEDRLDHQLHRGLHHPVPDRRDAERALAAVGLGDHHAPHWIGPIGPLTQRLPDPGQPLLPLSQFERRKANPVHTRCPAILARHRVGVGQDVLAPDLVVEQIEAEVRLRLRLEIELLLKAPDPFRCFEAHRQSPSLTSPSSKACRKSGPFPPPALPGLNGRTNLSDTRRAATTCAARGGEPRPTRPPPITRIALPACYAHYPGGPERVHVPVPSPLRAAFPVTQSGRRPHRYF